MLPSGKFRGRGVIGSVCPVCILLGLTLRTPCSQPAWSLFCYKPEVNRFYSSYKPVTKVTVLISIINIHNSSSSVWQASWAILHKSWTLGIFLLCLQRCLVLWTLETRMYWRLDTTWPPIGNWISYGNKWTFATSTKHRLLLLKLKNSGGLPFPWILPGLPTIEKQPTQNFQCQPESKFLITASTGPAPWRLWLWRRCVSKTRAKKNQTNKGTYSFWAQSSAFGAEGAVRIAEWEESQVCSALPGRDVVYYF